MHDEGEGLNDVCDASSAVASEGQDGCTPDSSPPALAADELPQIVFLIFSSGLEK